MSDPQTIEELFGPPISVYTREQALEDGVLVDARAGDFAEVTAQYFPPAAGPVVMTRELFELIRRAVENERHCNDYAGVWHDVLWMSRGVVRVLLGCSRAAVELGRPLPPPLPFRVIITGAGRRRYHDLQVSIDEALTFAVFGED